MPSTAKVKLAFTCKISPGEILMVLVSSKHGNGLAVSSHSNQSAPSAAHQTGGSPPPPLPASTTHFSIALSPHQTAYESY
jgi:hypothetical protein